MVPIPAVSFIGNKDFIKMQIISFGFLWLTSLIELFLKIGRLDRAGISSHSPNNDAYWLTSTPETTRDWVAGCFSGVIFLVLSLFSSPTGGMDSKCGMKQV